MHLLLLALTFTAHVEKIVDGDSFFARDTKGQKVEIRISGIDAPEGTQKFGKESRASLERLVGGKDIQVDVVEMDRYGRLVSRVMRDGRDAGLTQLQSGMAWTYPWAGGMARATKDQYLSAETGAKKIRAGLWSDAAPVAPWLYRREGAAARPTPQAGPVIGNRGSKLYHLAHCPGYTATSPKNRVVFASIADAEKAGYRRAANCR